MQNSNLSQANQVEVIWTPLQIHHQANYSQLPAETRVAAYCRVSSNLESQLESIKIQELYYRSLIRKNPDWQMVGVFCDEGVTGTRSDKRPEFQRMMRLASEGKIDRILSKSVARFCRNIADFLEAVRFLKSKNISLYFEREGIDTSSESSEFLISTLAAISQEESRSISDNILWSYSKRFQNGEPVFRRILGYDVWKDGQDQQITVNQKEAPIVQEIYKLALDGKGLKEIAQYLMDHGYTTSRGKKEWAANSVKEILQNERYTGAAICQKSYTHNHISHRRTRNNGERAKYIIQNHHTAIIDCVIFDRVQEILRKKQFISAKPRTIYPLSGSVVCGVCGANYNHYATAEPSWRCSKNMKSMKLCDNERITELRFGQIMSQAMAARYDFSDPRLVSTLKKDIEHANSNFYPNQLSAVKIELQEMLVREAHQPDLSHGVSTEQRNNLEQRVDDLSQMIRKLDRDRKYRMKALSWMDHLPKGLSRNDTVRGQISVELMRAWVMSIRVLSPILFDIEWFDGTRTSIEIETDGGKSHVSGNSET